ncbi:MAG: tripartite tricarboxylate transporter substrate-binding protein, partial [Xanthobacteraceae bacterium]
APAKTPMSIVKKMHDATEKALQDPAVREHLAKIGVEPKLMSVAQFAAYFKKDYAATMQLAKDAHITPVD